REAAACGWRREETAWRRTDVDGDCFPSDVRALRCLLAADNQLIFPNVDGLLPE
ncbi:Os10g0338500, partial [Oryza sativa Japonica Group]